MEPYIFEVNVEVVEPCVYCCSAQQQANVGGRDRYCIALSRWGLVRLSVCHDGGDKSEFSYYLDAMGDTVLFN